MLLAAEHSDGTPMADEEIRDELHDRAGRRPRDDRLLARVRLRGARALAQVLERLADGDDDYLEATINEVMRRRPVLPNPEPRLVKQEITIGDWTYPEGVILMAGAYLVHHDPKIYPDPYAFRPERFLDTKPGTYTWLPFGGGRRRCLGASFALLEMRIVLREASRALRHLAGRAQAGHAPAHDHDHARRRRTGDAEPACGSRVPAGAGRCCRRVAIGAPPGPPSDHRRGAPPAHRPFQRNQWRRRPFAQSRRLRLLPLRAPALLLQGVPKVTT